MTWADLAPPHLRNHFRERTDMPLPVPRHQIKAHVLHCYDRDGNNDKVYVIWIENRGGDLPFFVCGGYGKRTIGGMLKVDPKGSFSSLSEAERVYDQVHREKQSSKKGYIDVETSNYRAHMDSQRGPTSLVLFEEFVNPSKIDVSRIIGYSTGSTVTASGPSIVSAKKEASQGSTRVRRSVSL